MNTKQFFCGLIFASYALMILGCSTTSNTNTDEGITVSSSEEFKTTASGLKYRIINHGPGRFPTASDTVQVHYKGWLDNGKEFDSSYKRGEPIEFPLSGVIPGWTEGVQLVAEGGEIELEIPSELGYGARGAGADIPPNSTLHFTVELLEIK